MNNTGQNIMQMQREAAGRVQRMQEQSYRLVREHPVNVYRGVTFTPAKPGCDAPAPLPASEPLGKRETPRGRPEACKENQASDDGLVNLLQSADQDRTLVLLLVIILVKNGAPLELLLALLYIIL